MTQRLLEVTDLSMKFGGLLAVDGMHFHLGSGEIVSIIGPNGAGKTTVFNCLTGFYRPDKGVVLFNNTEIQRMPCHKIARMGMVRTFQNIRLFQKMTVLEILLIAQHKSLNTNLLSGLFKTATFRKSETDALDKAMFWLDQIGMVMEANREADHLSYGQQRRLEIARCMVTTPNLLLLDEPAAGLNPKETELLDELIESLRSVHDVSVLLIEHDMKLVMNISDRIYVMNQGCPLACGKPDEIRCNPDVIKAYLGES